MLLDSRATTAVVEGADAQEPAFNPAAPDYNVRLQAILLLNVGMNQFPLILGVNPLIPACICCRSCHSVYASV